MFEAGYIKQFRPFSNNPSTVNINNKSKCKIGISVSQDDFMSWKATQDPESKKWSGQDIVFEINDQEIHLGRTYMYQVQQQDNFVKLVFPDGAPPSTKVQVVYFNSLNNSTVAQQEGQ